MRPEADPRRLVALGLLWLAIFSLQFTVGSATGLWPPAEGPGAFHADLPVGLAFGAALAVSLLRGPSGVRR